MYMFVYVCLFVFLVRFFNFLFFFARRPAMLGLMGFSGSLPFYVIHRYYIFVFIDRANKDACLLVTDAQTDGERCCDGIVRAMYGIAR